MQNIIPYDELPEGSRQKLMDSAARWLSIKPELIGEVKTDKELIERIISFAKVLYEYFPVEEDPEYLKEFVKGMFK